MARSELRGGKEADFAFGIHEDWDAFLVVDLHGVEEISRPFHYELTLAQPAGRGLVPLGWFLDRPATLAIASPDRAGFHLRHGVVAEAAHLDTTGDVLLYRVVLAPHWTRARHRTRCRTFLDRSLREIVTSVLSGEAPALADQPWPSPPAGPGAGLEELLDVPALPALAPSLGPGYAPPRACFRWALDRSAHRADDREAHAYTVQYNESDFDFVARLLEAEGLSYVFEHAAGLSVLWITDEPGLASIFASRRALELGGRALGMQPEHPHLLRSFRAGLRVRSRAVTLRDYDWRRSTLIAGPAAAPGAGWAEHYEFPAGDEGTRRDPGEHAARVRLERFEVERSLAHGAGSAPGLQAGQRFTLAAHGEEERAEHLFVRVEIAAVQHVFPDTALDDEAFPPSGEAWGPRVSRAAPCFDCRFEALSAAVPFRPARSTPRPRVAGVQSAVVTDHRGGVGEEEIFCDAWARVRVRFPWDQRDDGQPSSAWIRASQEWAGAGFGAVFVPRVGQEVLVAYEQGDPDRPVIVGRLYNVRNPPPLDVAQSPDQSVIRSASTPRAEGYNELRFRDRAGDEELYLRAQRDLTEEVRAHHVSRVGGDRRAEVTGDRDLVVRGQDHTTVSGPRLAQVAGAEVAQIGGDRTASVRGVEALDVGGARGVNVAGDQEHSTGGAYRAFVGRDHELHVRGSSTTAVKEDLIARAGRSVRSDAKVDHAFASPVFHVQSDETELAQKKTFVARVGKCVIRLGEGSILLDNGAGAALALTGDKIIARADGTLTLVAASELTVKSAQIHLKKGAESGQPEEPKESEPKKRSVALRVSAHAAAESVYQDQYVLRATDRSFSQTKVPASGEVREGHAEVVFEDVPAGKTYDVVLQRGDVSWPVVQGFEVEV